MKNDALFVLPQGNVTSIFSITELGRRYAKAATDNTWRPGYSSLPLGPYKVYFEVFPISWSGSSQGIMVGINRSTVTNYPGYDTTGVGFYFTTSNNVQRYYNNSGTNISTWTAGGTDVFGIAFDPATGKVWFAKNNTWVGSGDPVNGTNPQLTLTTGVPYFVAFGSYDYRESARFNFSAEHLKYAPPDGFFAYGDSIVSGYSRNTSLAPVAIYPLNETTGTTATDLINSANGTLSGTPSLNQAGVGFDIQAVGIQFDGTDDYISMPDSVFTAGYMASSWSIDFWMKVVSADENDSIIYLGSTTDNKSDQIAVVVGPTGDRYLKVLFNDSANNALTSLVASAATLGTGGSWGKWLHVALVKSGTNTCTLYINGSQIDSQSITGLTTVARTVFRICRDEGTNYANAVVSSFAFYASALSISAVKRHCWAGFHYVTYNSLYCMGVILPIGYWKLSEPTGTKIYDLTKNERDGTLYGTVTYSESGGILADYEKSLKFDGNTACVEFADAAWNQLTSSLSISAWIKHDSSTPSTDEGIFTKFINDSGYTNKRAYALVWQSDNKLRFSVSSDGSAITSVITTGALTANTWYHVVAVYTASSKLEIYVNGAINNTNSTSIPASLYASNAPVYIGNHFNLRATNSTQYYFAGWLQDIFLCSKAMSSSEVTTVYNSGITENRFTNGSLVTLNPSDKSSSITLWNSNFSAYSGSAWKSVRATLGRRSGKFYFEAIWPNTADYGLLAMVAGVTYLGYDLENYMSSSSFYPYIAVGDNNGSASVWGTQYLGGTWNTYYTPNNTAVNGLCKELIVTGFAIDFDAGKLWVAINNTWIGNGDPANGLNPTQTANIYGCKLYPTLNPHTNGSYSMSIAMTPKMCVYSPPTGFNYWDQSGEPTNVDLLRVTKVSFQVMYSAPMAATVRVTKTIAQMIAQCPNANKRTGNHYWSRMMLQYVVTTMPYFRLYTQHVYAIVKKPSSSTVYKLSGYVTLAGHPVSRYVRAHRSSSGLVVGTTVSHPTTGYFEIITTYNLECYIIAFDDLNAPDLGSLIFDRVLPVQQVI